MNVKFENVVSYKETRKIIDDRVRIACIKYNWYTIKSEEYYNISEFICTLKTATKEDIEIVAVDIRQHSKTEYDITEIMFILANECCITFFY